MLNSPRSDGFWSRKARRLVAGRAGAADFEELAAGPGLGGHGGQSPCRPAGSGPGRRPCRRSTFLSQEDAGLGRRGDRDADGLGRLQGHHRPAQDARVAARRPRLVPPGQAVDGPRLDQEVRRPSRPPGGAWRRRSGRRPRRGRGSPSSGSTSPRPGSRPRRSPSGFCDLTMRNSSPLPTTGAILALLSRWVYPAPR